MAIKVFCWLGVGVGLVHRIRCDFYEPANWTIGNGILLGQTTELYIPDLLVDMVGMFCVHCHQGNTSYQCLCQGCTGDQ